MTCDDYREKVTVHLAEGSEAPGDHGASCPECARYAERARAAWDAAGRWPVEDVPPPVAERFHSSCRRPRRADLTLLRPGPLAAAAVLVVSAIVLFRAGKTGTDERSFFEADGTSVERYELPAGVDAARVAEEIRRDVAPDAWGGGECGLEFGDGYVRIRASEEIHRAVREHLRKLRQ